MLLSFSLRRLIRERIQISTRAHLHDRQTVASPLVVLQVPRSTHRRRRPKGVQKQQLQVFTTNVLDPDSSNVRVIESRYGLRCR